jgi:hypothetical protein
MLYPVELRTHYGINKIRLRNRKQRFRRQHGTAVERTDGFYIRFHRDREDGERTRSQNF